MAEAPPHCPGCAVFALLEDVIRSALQGGLGQRMRVPEALPSPAPGGGHRVIARGRTGQAERDPIERLAKVRGSLYGRLATIDNARREIARAARYGDGVPKAVWVEILHHTATIAKQAKKARETLAATGLRR